MTLRDFVGKTVACVDRDGCGVRITFADGPDLVIYAENRLHRIECLAEAKIQVTETRVVREKVL